MLKILIAILVFGLIIFVHELGHFLVAKLMGVKVNEFAMGMGPKLFSFVRGETTYSLRLLPIGGFCAMEGEDAAGAGEVRLKDEGEAAEDTAGEVAADTGEPAEPAVLPATQEDAPSRDPRAFCNKKVWRRVLIVIAGATMNLILGFVLMVIYYGAVLQPEEGRDEVPVSYTHLPARDIQRRSTLRALSPNCHSKSLPSLLLLAFLPESPPAGQYCVYAFSLCGLSRGYVWPAGDTAADNFATFFGLRVAGNVRI